VELGPEDGLVRQNYARLLFLAGDIDGSDQAFAETRRLRPFDDSVLSDLARVRLRQGRSADALSLLRRALELNPASMEARQLLTEAQDSKSEN